MGNTNGRRKRDATTEQLEYVYRVKETLSRAFGESKLSKPQLLEMLEATYGFNINKGTLDNLFRLDNPNIDYACLVTVADFFGCDLKALLTPKIKDSSFLRHKSAAEKSAAKAGVAVNKTENDPFFESISGIRSKFPVLEDDGYTGEFVGFILPPTTSNDSISQFDLTMKKDEDGVMKAKVVRTTTYYSSKTRTMRTEQFVYHGVPLYAKKYKAVLIFMTDEKAKGEFYFLSFGFEEYRTDEGLVFRQGLSVTGQAIGRGTLVAQNFLVFNKPIEDTKMKYISGLLKAPNNEFCVPVEEAEKLAEKYPEVRKFMADRAEVIERNRRQVYIFYEDNIISDKLSSLSAYDRIKAILLLKSKSTIGSKYYYTADCKYSGFVKNYLLNDEEEVSSETMYEHPQ